MNMGISKMMKALTRLLAGAMLVTCISCTPQKGPSAQSVPNNQDGLIGNNFTVNRDGQTLISMQQVANTLGLRLEQEEGRTLMGFTDVMFEVQPNLQQAVSYGNPVTLQDPPIAMNNQVYLTPNALSQLLQTDDIRIGGPEGLAIGRLRGGVDEGNADQDEGVQNPEQSNRIAIMSVAQNRSKIAAYAKRYLGVPYKFGAKPYAQSKRFDCSTFTQHVYKHFGQTLPRTARDQAKRGHSVSRSNLKVGDLVFFTVKGRFKSDRIPGHVGIYIGNGNMIHTWGSPGVQISSIDKGYWRDVRLFMRRIP